MKCLTLYAGAGGADLGMLFAGVEHVACVDANADCVATLIAAGLPGVRAGIGGPYEDAPAFDATPYAGAVDLVWASPPCQPYSRAGKGLGADDPRDGWPHTLAVLRVVGPRWAVIENVSGAPVEVWTADLEASGYRVSRWTMDAADYGTPQNRVREFLVAGPVVLPCPRPTHSLYALAAAKWTTGAYWTRHGIDPVGEPTAKERRALGRLLDPGHGLLPWRTMRDVLPGLTMAVGGGTNPRFPGDVRTERDLTDEPSTTIAGPSGNQLPEVARFDPKHPPCAPDAPATTIRSGGSGHSAPPMYVRTEQAGATGRPLDEPSPTVPTGGNQYLHDRDPGARRASEPGRLDRPAPTVTTTEEKGTRAHGTPPTFNGGPDRASDAAWLAVGRRRLTVEECATLCAFPNGYPFQGTKTSRYRQVGNCVVPPVAEVIARAVLDAHTENP